MGKPSGPAAIWSQYLAARSAGAVLACSSPHTTLHFGRAAGRLIHRIDKRHRRRAEASIARAFPEWPDERVRHTALAGFEHFTQLVTEMLQTPRVITRDSWPRYIGLGNLGGALAELNQDQPLLLITGHLGNWELLGFIVSVLGYDMEALARPLDNPKLDDWVTGVREHRGLKILNKFEAAKRMPQIMADRRALGFVADQNAGDRGLFVPFFGRLASTYKSIGLMAMRNDAPIVVSAAHRIGPGFRYELNVVDLIQPDDWADQPDPLYYITARYIRGLEQAVRLKPEQYLWMHRRWKSRPRHEREGNPLPKALTRKLEALPWMTDQLMADVQIPIDPKEHEKRP